MNRLQRMNQWMTPRMPVLILCALVLGLLFPSQIGILCPYVTTMMMFQTFANSLGSSVQDLARVLSHPKPVLVIMLTLHILMPLLALGIGSLLYNVKFSQIAKRLPPLLLLTLPVSLIATVTDY